MALKFISAKPSKRLTFVYLANDVIQNAKKKAPEFNKDFAHILPDAFTQAAKYVYSHLTHLFLF